MPVIGLLLAGAVNAVPLSVNVVLPKEVGHKYSQNVYGSNCYLLTRPIDYNMEGFIDQYVSAYKPFFRFPGGTASNFFNPLTGFLDPTPQDESRNTRNSNTNNSIEDSHPGGYDSAGFFDFVNRTGGRYSIPINMTTMDPEQTRKALQLFKSHGGSPEYFELGNEVYFGTYSAFITDVHDYIEKAKAYTAVIHEEFPDALVGALIPSHIYTHESFLAEGGEPDESRQGEWLSEIVKEDFYDAIVVHMYSDVGMDGNTAAADFLEYDEAFHHAISHVDGKFEEAMNNIRYLFPDKKVWVTEYHVGGFSGDLRNYRLRYSYLGNLFTAFFYMRLLERPEVALSHWHSFIQMINWSWNNQTGEYEFGHGVSYDIFSEVGALIRRNLYLSNLELEGAASYQGIGEYPDGGSELFGTYLHGFHTGEIVLINKSGNDYLLGDVTVDGTAEGDEVEFLSGIQLRAKDGMDLHEALASESEITRAEITAENISGLSLPPYSLTLLRLKQDWKMEGLVDGTFRINRIRGLEDGKSGYAIAVHAEPEFRYHLVRSLTLNPAEWMEVDEAAVDEPIRNFPLEDNIPFENSVFYRVLRTPFVR